MPLMCMTDQPRPPPKAAVAKVHESLELGCPSESCVQGIEPLLSLTTRLESAKFDSRWLTLVVAVVSSAEHQLRINHIRRGAFTNHLLASRCFLQLHAFSLNWFCQASARPLALHREVAPLQERGVEAVHLSRQLRHDQWFVLLTCTPCINDEGIGHQFVADEALITDGFASSFAILAFSSAIPDV
eukprot:2309555-Amphidinium_carterae.2